MKALSRCGFISAGAISGFGTIAGVAAFNGNSEIPVSGRSGNHPD
jgi:hypothetical protein